MGNPLSHLLTEISLNKMEERMQREEVIRPSWVRYVHNIFAVVNRQYIINTITSFNNIHKKNTFTMETEVNYSFPFLDVKVKNNNNKSGAWYLQNITDTL